MMRHAEDAIAMHRQSEMPAPDLDRAICFAVRARGGPRAKAATSLGWPGRRVAALMALALVSACSGENRALGSDQPQTPPHGADDPRTSKYEKNSYQVSQGGRYFTWFGCEGCHGIDATGVRNLMDSQWRYGGAFDQVYRSIAQGRGDAMPAFGAKIPLEQLWQISAYVRQLQNTKPAMIRQQDLDQQGEPQAGNWSGAIR
jgi:mono/diheme cytochrome c family protein